MHATKATGPKSALDDKVGEAVGPLRPADFERDCIRLWGPLLLES